MKIGKKNCFKYLFEIDYTSIYKALTIAFFMVKIQEQQQLKKACYGTKEWSENSGICNRCILRDSCGKIDEINNLKVTRKSKRM